MLKKYKGVRLSRRAGRKRCPWWRALISASILIADDDPNILRALSFIMQREGYFVRTATDGAEVLQAIATRSPDVLLLDVMMPRGNGYDICRTLRASPDHDGISIVMLTARGNEEERRTGLALGADAYVTKPFAIGEVVGCVTDVLARPRRGNVEPN